MLSRSIRRIGAALALLFLATAAPFPPGAVPAAAAPVEAYRRSDSWRSQGDDLLADAFFRPGGIALDLDPDRGELLAYIADSGNHRVQVFGIDATYRGTIGGPGTADEGGLASPHDVAVQGSLVLVSDSGHDRVALFTVEGTRLGDWPGLAAPWGIAISPSGLIAVVENRSSQVSIFRADGQRLATWGGFGEGVGQLNRPRGAAFTADGRLIVADRGNERLVVFDVGGRSIEEARLISPPEDLEVDPSSGEILVSHLDGSIRRYADQVSLPPVARPGTRLQLPGVSGLALARDAGGITHLLARFADDRRPLHGIRHWLGSPPRDPADNAEWGDFEPPLGRLDAPYRLAASQAGALVADRWPRVQDLDSNGLATWQIATGRINDVAKGPDSGIWAANDLEIASYLPDGSETRRAAVTPPIGGYSWLVALASDASGAVFGLDVGGQQIVRMQDRIEPVWSFGPAGGAPIALWDFAPGPPTFEAWYFINRSADSLEIRSKVDGALLSAVTVPGRPLRVDSDASGAAYVLNAHGWVLKYAPDGTLLAAWDARNAGDRRSSPSDLAVDAQGRVLVADPGLDEIGVFEPDPRGQPGPEPEFELRCAARGDKRADPTRLVLGEETAITLEVRGDCPQLTPPSDVVLVIDYSGSMIGAKMDAARQAGLDFVDGMSLGRDRVAVVGFNQEAILLAPLTDDAILAREAISGLVAGGGTDIAAGVDEARIELTGARRRLSAASVVILLTDGGSDVPAALRAADQLRLEGARLFTIGFGAGANAPLLSQMASSPDDYYFAPAADDLARIYLEIARRIAADLLFTTLTVRDELPANMAFVPGSGRPAPQVNGRLLTWQLSDVALSGITLTYRVQPLETGLHPTNVVAVGEGSDGLGQRGRVDFPVPEVEVIGPTATPTPSPTPTASPTRGPTPIPQPIYLPLLQRGQCLRRERVDVVLVIDSSDSMLAAAPSGRSKLALAIEAAAGFAELLDLEGGDAIALIHFNVDAGVDLDFSRDPAALRRALDGLPQASGTRIDLGLEAAARVLAGAGRSPGNRPAVILLTDGRPSGTGPDEVIRAAGLLAGQQTPIYAIGLGDDVDAALLGQIAGSPARLILTPDAEALHAIYAGLARDLPCDRP
jgi:Mg-chelatase subunit ChlD/sugar lactone lactonase YvrE